MLNFLKPFSAPAPVLLFLLTLASQTSHAELGDGTGVGSGNGFPGDPSLQVDGQPLKEFPAKQELLDIAHRLGREVPSLAARIVGLENRFEHGKRFGLVFYPMDYGYNRAVSANSDVLDSEGYPLKAKITVFNEFMKMAAAKQAWILAHEFVHILWAGDNEDRAQKISAAIETLASDALTPQERKQAFDVIADLIYKVKYIHSNNAAIEVYLPSPQKTEGLPAACRGFTVKKIKIGRRELVFPVPPEGLVERLDQDPAFRYYRDECLKASPEGLSLLRGLTSHPYLEALFVETLIGKRLSVVLADEESEYDRSRPIEAGALPSLGDARPLPRTVSLSWLATRIPGISDWLKVRAANLTSEEQAQSSYFNTQSLLELPLRWLRWQGSDSEGRLLLSASEEKPETADPVLFLSGNASEGADCGEKISDRRIELDCRYDRYSSDVRHWRLDLIWAAAAYRSSASEAFRSVGAVEIVP